MNSVAAAAEQSYRGLVMRIELRADYFADPLWAVDGGDDSVGMIDLDHLDMSAKLRAALRSWAAEFDALLTTGYEWPSRERADLWWRRGGHLAQWCNREMRPGYEVEYVQPRPAEASRA